MTCAPYPRWRRFHVVPETGSGVAVAGMPRDRDRSKSQPGERLGGHLGDERLGLGAGSRVPESLRQADQHHAPWLLRHQSSVGVTGDAEHRDRRRTVPVRGAGQLEDPAGDLPFEGGPVHAPFARDDQVGGRQALGEAQQLGDEVESAYEPSPRARRPPARPPAAPAPGTEVTSTPVSRR